MSQPGPILKIVRERISTAIFKAAASIGGKDRALAEQRAADVERALLSSYGAGTQPTVAEIQDIVERVLIQNGHARTARAYIIYRHERAQARATRAQQPVEASDNIPYKKIYEVLRWNMDHGCETVAGVN
ncbi:MAG: ATP cone domain-containing protein, partial [Kiritimatiellaeota bacterium]|nr:ATP cone domain-containing protein [Kiritimatiellota bacterium]